jgi:Zn-dependent protease with chaperone function
MLMAKAGYDPTNAVDLWIRFSAASPSSKPRYAFVDILADALTVFLAAHACVCVVLKYLSTHPPNADRIARLKRWMPQALDQYHTHASPQATAVIV